MILAFSWALPTEHAFTLSKLPQVLQRDVVFALLLLEGNQINALVVDESSEQNVGPDEPAGSPPRLHAQGRRLVDARNEDCQTTFD
jgi:hypothetical protein